MIKDQSYLNNESHVLFHDSNDELQRPCQLLCYIVNDEDILIAYDLDIVFDEIQENSERLSIVDDDNEKQFYLIPFDGNQFQYIDKPALWNKVCFIAFNHPEDLMLYAFHDPLVSLLQSSIQEEFTQFVNACIGSSGKVELPLSFFFCLLEESVTKIQLATCSIGYTRGITTHY